MKNLLSYSYDDLNNSWNHMHVRHDKWLQDVQEQATCLRDEVAAIINPPSEFWDEHGTIEPQRYVEVVELFEKKTSLNDTTSLSRITDNGEFLFGLSIAFDKASKTLQKHRVHVPVAVRFHNGIRQFGFYDPRRKTVESSPAWEDDMEMFIEMLLNRIKEFLDTNQFIDYCSKSAISLL
jgi:hypothetical protein